MHIERSWKQIKDKIIHPLVCEHAKWRPRVPSPVSRHPGQKCGARSSHCTASAHTEQEQQIKVIISKL